MDISYEGMVDEIGLDAARIRAEEIHHYRMALAATVIDAFRQDQEERDAVSDLIYDLVTKGDLCPHVALDWSRQTER